MAGGGGGGGGADTFGSGGAGGSAGSSDFSGQQGARAYGLSTDCGNGGGGGGGSKTTAGTGGTAGCESVGGGAGDGFFGANGVSYSGKSDPLAGLGAGGAGGGGWYGGGSGGAGYTLGGGGGGAGSSYATPSAFSSSSSTDTTRSPSITITPLPTPQTVATLAGTKSGTVDWFTSAVTVTLTASDPGGPGVGKTLYAIDNPDCSAVKQSACTQYTAPFTVSTNALHTLTYFSLDTIGLDEALQTRNFVVTVTSTSVRGAVIASGTDPWAAAATQGSEYVRVTGSGTGIVGTAVYSSNPGGAPLFNASGAYIDVIVAGSGLTSVTIYNCNILTATEVYWWTGTTWATVSNQTYDPVTKCITIIVNSTTVPKLSDLTGTPFGAGSPPTTTATAKTADGKTYVAGTWTNQSVTVAFTCSPNSTPTGPVTRATDGQNQSATGSCTDGLGQTTPMTFTGINVDKTPPTCSVAVNPPVLWPPNSKDVPITGTVTAGDNLSGLASVIGGPVTGNEALSASDTQGFVLNTPYSAPLKLSAILNIAGQLKATREGKGSGRIYSQTVTVTDQAGNKNASPCLWTVTVPHNQ